MRDDTPDSQRRNAPVPEQLSLPWAPVVVDDFLPQSPDLRALLDAQLALRAGLADGTSCECCGRHAQRYNRSLNSTMARGLIWLVRQAGALRAWVPVQERAPAWLLRSKQLPTLRLWNLVEPKPKDPGDTKKRSSGIWRPTIHGVNFCMGGVTVPKVVTEYQSMVLGYSDKQIHIRRALSDKFDYFELMGWRPEPPVEPSPPPVHHERNPPPSDGEV